MTFNFPSDFISNYDKLYEYKIDTKKFTNLTA